MAGRSLLGIMNGWVGELKRTSPAGSGESRLNYSNYTTMNNETQALKVDIAVLVFAVLLQPCQPVADVGNGRVNAV